MYVCIYKNIFFNMSEIEAFFTIAIGRAYFLFIVLQMASKIPHVSSYH